MERLLAALQAIGILVACGVVGIMLGVIIVTVLS